MRPKMSSTQLGGIANLALLAPVRPGFVEGFETVTYARRLELLLKTLNAIRLASREASLATNPFPDSVGRFGILHSFRYAIVPPDIGSRGVPDAANDPSPGLYRLSLNVAFDGGWETYMRVIYSDLGSLLDAIFCNCVGYPASRLHSFDEYTRWVRDHELAGGLFYTESPMTVKDQRYLEAVEKLHREGASSEAADLASAGFALKETPTMAQSLDDFVAALQALDQEGQARAVAPQLRALKALNDLTSVYPKNRDEDDQCLLRFAQGAMREFVTLLRQAPPSDALQKRLEPFRSAINWITAEPRHVALPRRELNHDPRNLQAGIVSRYPGITHGCLVLLRVTQAAAARDFLAGLEVNVEGDAAHGMCRNVALTLAGLKALEVPAGQTDLFPQEFIEGMEARCGLLGDVRGNHPNAWRRPTLHGASKPTEIDLASVHVVVQYRLKDPDNKGYDLNPAFEREIDCFDEASGLAVLALEPMRSYPDPVDEARTREHFGFADGISQPLPDGAPTATFWKKDGVARGEILLGYPNDRGDGAYPPAANLLLDDGTFLVVRKIRQRVDVLEQVLPHSAENIELREKLMGRRHDGEPLVTLNNNAASGNLNDFDYAHDPQGAQCPFHSHTRRTNPRGGEAVPRIIRRGMSYGPRSETDLTTERGVYFMAYCASIAEQFEVIQRWVTGGNSSGVLSTQSDPFLGVPQPNDERVYRFINNGAVVRVKLGDKPLTELQWGLYLFVPSLRALKGLTAIAAAAQARAASPLDTPAGERSKNFKSWQHKLEDPSERDKAWKSVADAPNGTVDTDYGRLIACPQRITAVLQDQGTQYSVRGYGRRLDASLGIGYLGLDGAEHTRQAETPEAGGVNQAIAAITEAAAFDQAAMATKLVLHQITLQTGLTSGRRTETAIDIAILSEQVLALLCRHWFGLPDDKGRFMVAKGRSPDLTGAVRCPGHFLSVARYVFSPHPSPTVVQDAQAHGKAILKVVGEFLAAMDEPDPPRMGPLAQAIVSRLTHVDSATVARTLAGVMLGFPPTVHGNFVSIMRAWLEVPPHTDRSSPEPVTSVWNLQAELVGRGLAAPEHGVAGAVLRGPLIAQMRKAPVPAMIWREDPALPVDEMGEPPNKVVLGLAGAMQDTSADSRLMFGGARKAPKGAPPEALATEHGCPGYDMALGVMMGMMTELMLRGTLRPTASPTIVNLVT